MYKIGEAIQKNTSFSMTFSQRGAGGQPRLKNFPRKFLMGGGGKCKWKNQKIPNSNFDEEKTTITIKTRHFLEKIVYL